MFYSRQPENKREILLFARRATFSLCSSPKFKSDVTYFYSRAVDVGHVANLHKAFWMARGRLALSCPRKSPREHVTSRFTEYGSEDLRVVRGLCAVRACGHARTCRGHHTDRACCSARSIYFLSGWKNMMSVVPTYA